MGAATATCSNCSCDQETGGLKILQTTAVVCPTGQDESLSDDVIRQTIATAKLEIKFGLPDGSCRSFSFTKKPLGLAFNRQLFLKRVKEDSQAAEMGVEEGWQILALNGHDVAAVGFQEAYDAIKEASERL
mmetsp:Transcript_13481/g.31991  ORF Transcript_13481/g.31991 Transcript_13481/m.31991 type:complete len:131 (+) Transcript_13481:23-415(+)